VQIKGEVTVVLPSKGKVDKVYYVLNNMTESLPFIQNADQTEVVFKVTHFSQYGLVYTKGEPAPVVNGVEVKPVNTAPTMKPAIQLLANDKKEEKMESQTMPADKMMADKEMKSEQSLPNTGSAESGLALAGLALGMLGATAVVRKKEQ
ncbi:LPXTG cell wall anchor domain-containing protein, partial [Streptococcus himalayensis]